MSELRAMWLSFFRSAGIPAGFDTKYAVIFDENRIRQDMMMDITKECLRDMGITAMGDIIAILKHAKKVHDESKEEALETPKPSSTQSTVQKVTNVSSESPPAPAKTPIASSTTAAPTSKVSVVSKALNIQKTIKTSSTSSTVTAKSSPVVARASSTKPLTAQKITSTAKSVPKKLTATSTPPINDDDSLLRKKIIILRNDSDSEDSSVQKEEVPFQKKVRVLPEHEGKYKIKMPEGTTPKTQKLLQTRLGPSPGAKPEPSKEKKLTVFERLGDSKVSSTCDSKSPVSASSSSTSSSQSSIPSAADIEKGISSVFARLGNKSGSSQSQASSKNEKSLLSTKFEIRQSVTTSSTSGIKSIASSSAHREAEKTLSVVRPRSTVSVRSDDLRRTSPSTTYKSGSGMRSDVLSRSRDSESVKARLGMSSRARSRSRSPPIKKRLMEIDDRPRRSRSPITNRRDIRNLSRPSSVVTAPPRKSSLATKVTVTSSRTRDRDSRGFREEDRERETSIRRAASGIIVKRSFDKSAASRSVSQDSLILPDDIEDPLAGCYSESD